MAAPITPDQAVALAQTMLAVCSEPLSACGLKQATAVATVMDCLTPDAVLAVKDFLTAWCAG